MQTRSCTYRVHAGTRYGRQPLNVQKLKLASCTSCIWWLHWRKVKGQQSLSRDFTHVQGNASELGIFAGDNYTDVPNRGDTYPRMTSHYILMHQIEGIHIPGWPLSIYLCTKQRGYISQDDPSLYILDHVDLDIINEWKCTFYCQSSKWIQQLDREIALVTLSVDVSKCCI